MECYKKHTDQELRLLAYDFYLGKIFTSKHIPIKDFNQLLFRVFAWLSIMPEDEFKKINDNPPGLIYEYMSKASPIMMIENYPFFLTCQMLSLEDADKMLDYVEEIIRIKTKYKNN